ncbi:MAG: PepSY domain-containing protein [Candidatus Competibacteraceae bacterium]
MTNSKRLLTAAALTMTTTFAVTALFAATPITPTPAATQPAVQSPAAATSAAGITKEQAIEMAQKAHPGKLVKAYQDAKKGKTTWEVQIQGDDGKKWEIHYEIKTGELVSAEAK